MSVCMHGSKTKMLDTENNVCYNNEKYAFERKSQMNSSTYVNKTNKIAKILFVVALIIFAVADGYMVWNQCSPDGDGTYISDVDTHIVKAIQPHVYSFLSVIFRETYYLFGENMYVLAVLCTLLMVISNVTSVLILHHMYKKIYNIKSGWKSGFLSLASVFVVAFFSHYIGESGAYSAAYANVWHNPTLLLMRPFMLCVIFATSMAFKNAEDGKPMGKYLVLSAVASLFCMWVKPSFFAAFLPALCVYLLIELIRTKGKSFMFSLKLGLSYLGTIPVLIYQYIVLYVYAPEKTEEVSSVYFKTNWTMEEILHGVYDELFSAWFIILGIILLLVFQKTNKKLLTFTGLYWVVSDIFYYFVKESGSRAMHGNFEWSKLIFLYVMMAFVAGEVFLKPAENDIPKKWKAIAGAVYAGHFITGLIYFASMVRGGWFFCIFQMYG